MKLLRDLDWFESSIRKPCRISHAQKLPRVGFFALRFEVLKVNIFGLNLAQWSRTPNDTLGIFLGPERFLLASELSSEQILMPADCEPTAKSTNLKFGRELPSIISGPRNFIQLIWSTGGALIAIFPGKVQKLPLFISRLLMMFHRLQDKFSNNLM